jgi:hypothetical protein
MTVSVATGHTEAYPLYLSIGNLHNNARRSHRGGVVVIAFLAIAKSKYVLLYSYVRQPTRLTKPDFVAEKEHSNNGDFRTFRRQLFHTSLAHILSSLRAAMSKPEGVKCADGLYRRVMYGLGPYIADYPEQVLISGIVQGWCPR